MDRSRTLQLNVPLLLVPNSLTISFTCMWKGVTISLPQELFDEIERKKPALVQRSKFIQVLLKQALKERH